MRLPPNDEIAYVAGFYEGEGSIDCGGKGQYLRLLFSQKETEPLVRIREILWNGDIRKQVHKDGHVIHRLRSAGAARVMTTVGMMWPWLSNRRKAQIKEAIGKWRDYSTKKPLKGSIKPKKGISDA